MSEGQATRNGSDMPSKRSERAPAPSPDCSPLLHNLEGMGTKQPKAESLMRQWLVIQQIHVHTHGQEYGCVPFGLTCFVEPKQCFRGAGTSAVARPGRHPTSPVWAFFMLSCDDACQLQTSSDGI